MTADIVNLRQVKKRKARVEKERQATENRVKFGRTKTVRGHEVAKKLLEEKRLDGLLRDRSKPDDDGRS